MMKIVAECPVMLSNHPGIMTNVLPLESFLHVLEKKRWLWMVLARFGGRRKRLDHITPWVAGPTILHRRGPSATSRRTVRL